MDAQRVSKIGGAILGRSKVGVKVGSAVVTPGVSTCWRGIVGGGIASVLEGMVGKGMGFEGWRVFKEFLVEFLFVVELGIELVHDFVVVVGSLLAEFDDGEA